MKPSLRETKERDTDTDTECIIYLYRYRMCCKCKGEAKVTVTLLIRTDMVLMQMSFTGVRGSRAAFKSHTLILLKSLAVLEVLVVKLSISKNNLISECDKTRRM